MAADLSIHVLEGVTEDDLSVFFSHTLGSKHCKLFEKFPEQAAQDKAWSAVSESPSVWVGEVSWLKADLLDAKEEFVPDIVGQVHEIIGENLPEIDDALIGKIHGAFFKSKPHTLYKVAEKEYVMKFLEEHRGKRVFTVSW